MEACGGVLGCAAACPHPCPLPSSACDRSPHSHAPGRPLPTAPLPPRPAAAQGLFHPARKVREVYWRLYNNVYIGAQVGVI